MTRTGQAGLVCIYTGPAFVYVHSGKPGLADPQGERLPLDGSLSGPSELMVYESVDQLMTCQRV